MVWPLIAAGITAGMGWLGASSAKKKANEQMWLNNLLAVQENNRMLEMQAQANQIAQANRNQDIALQKEFAQSGVQWRAQDAAAAGIHPVFALGGSGATYSPSTVSVGVPSLRSMSMSTPDAMGPALASMGQDIGRAINATRTAAQRTEAFDNSMRDLSVQNMSLRNELLGAQIAKLRAGSNPPMPKASDSGEIKLPLPLSTDTDVTPMAVGGTHVKTDRMSSDAQRAEDRYGDIAQEAFGIYNLYRDFINTTGSYQARVMANPFHSPRDNSGGLEWAYEQYRANNYLP